MERRCIRCVRMGHFRSNCLQGTNATTDYGYTRSDVQGPVSDPRAAGERPEWVSPILASEADEGNDDNWRQ
ncbi:unnamed protein product [Gordionus sp. m RMFG-2023]